VMPRPGLLRAAALAAGLLLLVGCGLPLPGGVRSPGLVPEEQPRDRQITVVPPGPRDGASPRDLVERFLVAQGSAEGDHAVARQFLTPDRARTWRDRGTVQVYDATSLGYEQTTPDTVTVTARKTAIVGEDGVYRRSDQPLVDTYRVRCAGARCRIAVLPDGLRLNANDLVRSFAPRSVYAVSPDAAPDGQVRHLVADLLWLPRDDLAGGLVRAVLAGPSSALEGSVETAAPPGARLLRPVRAAPDGTVTVDLSGEVRALDDLRRQELSAQLVWTLRALGTGFTRLRLLVDGRPLEVDGDDGPQPAQAWDGYDPERLQRRTPALYLAERRLRSLVDGGLASSAATEGQQPVDLAAVSPDGFLALLTDRPDGRVELRTGPQQGPLSGVRATGALSSPTWGSGERGLFLLRDGSVVRVGAGGGAVQVQVDGAPGRLRQVQVARDGVRVALLAGDADDPQLLVGRLAPSADGPRITGLWEIATGLRGLVDVAWESGTSLVVLGAFNLGLLPARVAVDGSSTQVLASRLPQGLTPVSLTAASGRPVVLAGRADGAERLYRDNGTSFEQQATGREPFYPG
jgi:Lipoprotein LpqB beta-propeller domain/Sporulation and spore germination